MKINIMSLTSPEFTKAFESAHRYIFTVIKLTSNYALIISWIALYWLAPLSIRAAVGNLVA